MTPSESPTCPRCSGEMKIRTSAYGPWWACLLWPTCRGKIDARDPSGAPHKAPPPARLGVPYGALPVRGVSPGHSGDPYQQAVIDHRSGWVVVSAAAGSGKSYSIVERTASLLCEGEVPEAICLLSYNADAAQLLRDRLKARVGSYAAKRLEIRTFHAWCYLVLRYWYPQDQRLWEGHILGGSNGPSPYKIAAPLASKYDIPVGLALRAAEKIAEGLHPMTPDGVTEALHWSAGNDKADRLAEFLRAYAAEKRERKLIDFGDMLSEVALAILYHPENEAVQVLSALYRHVMVDECQDASLPRSIVARWLGQRSQSLLCVGDPSQAIASHAGGRLDLFIDLATSPGVSVLSLPVNRRSSRRIVEASNEVIREQPWNLSGDTLPRDGAPDGEPIQVWETKTPNEESERVIQDIQRRVAAGTPMEVDGRPTFVCLLRTNALIVNLEHAFVARGIPVRIAGSPGGVWSSTAGTEFLAYLEGVEGIPTFNLLSVVNKPRRFAKKVEVGAIIEQAQSAEKMGVDFSLHDMLKEHTSKSLQRLGKDLSNAAELPWARRCKKVLAWLLDVEDEEEDPDEDRRGALAALCEAAVKAGSIAGIYQHKREASRGQREPAVELSTVHRCVAPETLVEVNGKLLRMDEIPASGKIATALGLHQYGHLVKYKNRAMLRITTRRGYTLNVTDDHGLYTWNGKYYVSREAKNLVVGDFLRFYIGMQSTETELQELPVPVQGDIREVVFQTPRYVTEEVAELLGLMVGDGTVYPAGFRLLKRHKDVVDRFSDLVTKLLGSPYIARGYGRNGDCYYAEVSSRYLSRWFLMIDGLAPNNKAIPNVIRYASVDVQKSFIRGLFEDGTVNIRDRRVDHIAWATKYEDMAKTVQTMLLRFGMVTTRMLVKSKYKGSEREIWRVGLYGQAARLFRDTIGFISAFKQGRLVAGEYAPEGQQNAIPVRKDDPRLKANRWAHQNGNYRGYVSRETVQKLGGFNEELKFYHDRVSSIEPYQGPAYCVTVPSASRFLQNGCDGANSKGKEWSVVYGCAIRSEVLPHKKCSSPDEVDEERRLLYVLVTRARDALMISTGGKPSKFLRELKWVEEKGEGK